MGGLRKSLERSAHRQTRIAFGDRERADLLFEQHATGRLFPRVLRTHAGNATDLRNMKFPGIEKLERMGRAYSRNLSQDATDELVRSA